MITIDDIATTEQLDGHALTAVRGGTGYPMPAELPSQSYLPAFPAFPPGFPFNVLNPTPQLIDPQDPRLQ